MERLISSIFVTSCLWIIANLYGYETLQPANHQLSSANSADFNKAFMMTWHQ